MEILNQILENSEFPVLTAFVLGLMTAISPCPLATNITAVGFISKNISNPRRVFFKGLVYTTGRAVSYTLLGILLYYGAEKLHLKHYFNSWGERVLGFLLVTIGLFMLGVIEVKLPSLSRFSEKMEQKARSGYWGTFLLGMIFALAFCPYSGVLYFGILMPLTVESSAGLFLPIVFAIATGIPVIIFAWIIAFSMHSLGKSYKKIQEFELWFRRIVAVLFIVVGLYYISIFFL